MPETKKIIVILGPTASGKTDLSIKLSKKYKGEVVSADSRQVYRGMDIGTGKVTKKEMKRIPHYLLDVASPKKVFTVSDYQKLATEAIKKIFEKGKIPFLVGGTGFYIQSVVDGVVIPQVPPDWKLRHKLEKESERELFKKLQKLDPERAKNIDKNNKRRLTRALEIISKTKKPVPKIQKEKPDFDVLIIGVKRNNKKLKELIRKRLIKRIKSGMLNEAKRLKKSGVSWKRMEELGLEYRYMAYYFQNKISYDDFVNLLSYEIEHYAKRQMTWFKRDKRIKWIKTYSQARQIVDKFINK